MREPAVVVLLKDTRELLSVPERWTKKAMARNAKGSAVAPKNSNAVCFCLLGALDKQSRRYETFQKAVVILTSVTNNLSIPTFNDIRKTQHADILAVLDKAIEKAKETPRGSY